MKVLIVGGYDYFSSALIMRLKREKHNTFIICGKVSETAVKRKHKADVEYHFDAFESNISRIIDDIRPDTVVFMGAFDPLYKWDQSRAASNSYLSALSNILAVSLETTVKRFIYISSTVSEEDSQDFKKGIEIPVGENLCLRYGETLCLNYKEGDTLDIAVLRLPSVFGIPEQIDENCGDLPHLITCALSKREDSGTAKYIDPLYISDAVEAIFKVINSKKREMPIYTLSSGYTLDTRILNHSVQKALESNQLTQTDYSSALQKIETVTEFNQDFSFHPFMSAESGIKAICKTFVDHKWVKQLWQTNTVKKSGGFWKWTKNIGLMFVPLIENLLLFALTILAIYYNFPDKPLLLTFYIVFVAAAMSRLQMSIAVLLAIGYYTLFSTTDYSLYRIVTNYSYIFTVLIMIGSGFIVSILKDKVHNLQSDKDFVLQNKEDEIADLSSMLTISRDIKTELESRLLNQSDSLAKIYEIVTRLDAVEARKVFSGALKVVSEIMHSKDVAIYMSSNNSIFFRNVGSSTAKARESMPTSIKIIDYPEMYDALKTENVFVNRALDPSLPIMALTIGSDTAFNVVIMLWSIGFKDLGLYHVNLFLVLRMIITNSIEKAYQYESATHAQRYIENTNILRQEFFTEVLRDHIQANEDSGSPYQVLKIMLSENEAKNALGFLRATKTKTEPKKYPIINETLIGSLRPTDYIGIGEDGSVMVILSGTTEADLPFVEKRLADKSILSERIPC